MGRFFVHMQRITHYVFFAKFLFYELPIFIYPFLSGLRIGKNTLHIFVASCKNMCIVLYSIFADCFLSCVPFFYSFLNSLVQRNFFSALVYFIILVQMSTARVGVFVGMLRTFFSVNMIADTSARGLSFFYVINCIAHNYFAFFYFSNYPD